MVYGTHAEATKTIIGGDAASQTSNRTVATTNNVTLGRGVRGERGATGKINAGDGCTGWRAPTVPKGVGETHPNDRKA